MSYATVYSRARVGIQAPLVSIEVHLSNGLPSFSIVGLPEATVRESKERVRSAIINSGLEFPNRRITVNLAPADLPKEGGRFDLAIAIGILTASMQLPNELLEKTEFYGELSLSGSIRPILGDIPAAIACGHQRRLCIMPILNARNAAIIRDLELRSTESLQQVVRYIRRMGDLEVPVNFPADKTDKASSMKLNQPDMADVVGQDQAKRAMEIAASGGHNIMLLGPPGSGKTMLAERITSILPPLSDSQALECAAIRSLGEQQSTIDYWRVPPFRSPHHGSPTSAIIGGGAIPKPGEISLAHNGILFLDELPEFDRRALDSMRQPLETGKIHLSRIRHQVSFPANFQLIAALNTSPTGHHKDGRNSDAQVLRYLNRISGPLIDRVDLQIEMPHLPVNQMLRSQDEAAKLKTPQNTSEYIASKVDKARSVMLQRAGKPNARLTGKELDAFCALSKADSTFLISTIKRLGLSMRAMQKIKRVALTIADLEGAKAVQKKHIAEALGYRAMDRLLVHLKQ